MLIKMNSNAFAISLILITLSLAGCDISNTDSTKPKLASTENTTSAKTDRFNGTWKVLGRTGNEDGSNEPICGNETAIGTATISGNKITGNVKNKSGFEYTVEGTVDNQGKVDAMLIYSGYDAAELMGTFSDNTAKGSWSDAVNACPGVWTATKIPEVSELPTISKDEKAENTSNNG